MGGECYAYLQDIATTTFGTRQTLAPLHSYPFAFPTAGGWVGVEAQDVTQRSDINAI